MSHVRLLKDNSLKATPQRLCVLNALDNYGHITLEQIQEVTKDKFPTLSLSTIYRNINEMLDKGVISEVKVSNKKGYFEISKAKHAHLVCEKCGKIEDLYLDNTNLLSSVQNLSEHQITNCSLTFDMICKDCK